MSTGSKNKEKKTKTLASTKEKKSSNREYSLKNLTYFDEVNKYKKNFIKEDDFKYTPKKEEEFKYTPEKDSKVNVTTNNTKGNIEALNTDKVKKVLNEAIEPPVTADIVDVSVDPVDVSNATVSPFDVSYKKEKLCNKNYLVASKQIPQIESEYIKPNIPSDCLVTKIPVLISELKVSLSCNSSLSLDKAALDIKDLKKNIHICECKFIPDVNKLLIKGHILSLTEYLTPNCNCSDSVELNSVKTKIPFEGIADVECYKLPEIKKSHKTNPIVFHSSTFCNDTDSLQCTHYEYFNEEIFFDILSAEITEITSKKQASIENKNLTNASIESNIFLELTLQLFQKQIVNVKI